MTPILTLPEHELAICLKHLSDIPREQHRRFLDVVANHIDPLVPCELTVEVISACHYARWLVREHPS